jgi:hypothetical protein
MELYDQMRIALVTCIVIVAAGCTSRPLGDVLLTIQDASARQEPEYLDVTCTAVLNNRTASSLVVTSVFYSAFDGLRLIVSSEDGKRLAEQPYVLHQSPSSIPGRPFVLPSGCTTQRMTIPVFKLPTRQII